MKLLKNRLLSSLAAAECFLRRKKLSFSALESDPWLAAAKNKHRGERCFIIATGPSLNDLDLSKLKGEVSFGVNGTYKLEQVDLTYFAYVSNWWHKQHIEGIRSVRCQRRFIPKLYQAELDSEIPTTWYNKIGPIPYSCFRWPMPIPADFSLSPDKYLHAGGSVVCICLQLAYYMGFDEVILIGLDHSYSREQDENFKKHAGGCLTIEDSSQTHFTSDYTAPGSVAHIDLQAMERGYALAKAEFDRAGRRILNASAKSQLKTFPRVKFDELF